MHGGPGCEDEERTGPCFDEREKSCRRVVSCAQVTLMVSHRS